MVAGERSSARLTLTVGMAMVILGVLGLGVTTVATSSSGSAQSSGTLLGSGPNLDPAPQHGLGAGQRIISWSGYKWLVYPSGERGPEGTKISSSLDAVHVDSQGRLHLAITKVHGQWRCAEIESLVPMSYGTYHWVVDSKVANFAKTVVLGMFVYRPGSPRLHNELDVEDSQFTHLIAPDNAQFAVQPYYATPPPQLHPYAISASQVPIYQAFTWSPGTPGDGIVHFESRAGATTKAPLLSKWDFQGYSVPTAFNMHLYMNLWLNTNKPPSGGTHSVIIRSFGFSPLA